MYSRGGASSGQDTRCIIHPYSKLRLEVSKVSRQTITGISLVVLAFRLFAVIWFLNKLPLAILHVQCWSKSAHRPVQKTCSGVFNECYVGPEFIPAAGLPAIDSFPINCNGGPNNPPLLLGHPGDSCCHG